MNLSDRTIGILVAPGFDDKHVGQVAEALREQGAKVTAIGMGESEAMAVSGRHGSLLKPDQVLSQVSADTLDGIIVPGGESAIRIRVDERTLTLLMEMDCRQKPIGAMCNATAVLAAAGLIADRRVTGDILVKRDLTEAGGIYLEQGVVVDHNLITLRSSANIAHFIDAFSFFLEPAPSLFS